MVINRPTNFIVGSALVLSWVATGCSRSEADLKEFESDSQRASVSLEAYFQETDRLASDEFLRIAEVSPTNVVDITKSMSNPILESEQLERAKHIAELRAILNAGTCLAKTSIGAGIAKKTSIGRVLYDLKDAADEGSRLPEIKSSALDPSWKHARSLREAMTAISSGLKTLDLSKDVSPAAAKGALKILSPSFLKAVQGIGDRFSDIEQDEQSGISSATKSATAALHCGGDPKTESGDPIFLWNWYLSKNSVLMDHPERQSMTNWIASIRFRSKLQQRNVDKEVIEALKSLMILADPAHPLEYTAVDSAIHRVGRSVDQLESVVQQYRQGL